MTTSKGKEIYCCAKKCVLIIILVSISGNIFEKISSKDVNFRSCSLHLQMNSYSKVYLKYQISSDQQLFIQGLLLQVQTVIIVDQHQSYCKF